MGGGGGPETKRRFWKGGTAKVKTQMCLDSRGQATGPSQLGWPASPAGLASPNAKWGRG